MKNSGSALCSGAVDRVEGIADRAMPLIRDALYKGNCAYFEATERAEILRETLEILTKELMRDIQQVYIILLLLLYYITFFTLA